MLIAYILHKVHYLQAFYGTCKEGWKHVWRCLLTVADFKHKYIYNITLPLSRLVPCSTHTTHTSLHQFSCRSDSYNTGLALLYLSMFCAWRCHGGSIHRQGRNDLLTYTHVQHCMPYTILSMLHSINNTPPSFYYDTDTHHNRNTQSYTSYPASHKIREC